MMKNLILYLCVMLLAIPAVEAQNNRAMRGTMRGTVINKRDKSPVAGATVQVLTDTLTTRTDSDGHYRIEGVRTGYNTLFVTGDGFAGQVTGSVLVTTSSPATVDVELAERNVEVDDVVITASLFTPSREAPVSIRRIGPEEIDLTPGANRDISKVVQSSPGVLTVRTANRNDVLVRGGGANENRYILDGIEIPVLNHFAVQGGSGGNASLVNTDLLGPVTFYSGAFPAQYASGLSSLLDMKMLTGNADRFHGKLVVGASDVGANIDTPISRDGRTTLTASYRHSYLELLFKVLKLPFLPTYNDYQFKINSKIDDRNEVYVLALGSFDNNRLNLGLTSPPEDRQYILGYMPASDQVSAVLGVGYVHSFDGGQLRLTTSGDYLSNRYYKYPDNDSSQERLYDLQSREGNVRMRLMLSLWDLGGFSFSAGVGGGAGFFRDRSLRYGEQTAADGNLDMGRYELFANLSRSFFDDRFSVTAGLRADGISYSAAMSNPFRQLSPRLSVSYKLSNRWTLSGSVGRFYQEPTYTVLGYDGGLIPGWNQRDGVRYMAVNQYVAGLDYAPNAKSAFKLEGFWKQYDHMPVSLADSLPVSTGDFADFIVGDIPVKSVGKGRAYGVEFSYRNLNVANTVLNFSYTFFVSQVNRLDKELGTVAGEYWSSSWDARHILNVSAIHKFGRNWTLGGKWSLTGGMPYTPYDEEYSSMVGAWDARQRPYADVTRYNAEREPFYHQLDVRIDKVWYFRKWRLGFYLDIQNIYNFKARGQDILMPVTNGAGQHVLDPARPGHYLMKHVERDLGGTILPTFGLTIEM